MSSVPSYIFTLSLHDALPIFDQHVGGLDEANSELSVGQLDGFEQAQAELFTIELHGVVDEKLGLSLLETDRKSTRLNSSHEWISYAVFCLKKKKKNNKEKYIQ